MSESALPLTLESRLTELKGRSRFIVLERRHPFAINVHGNGVLYKTRVRPASPEGTTHAFYMIHVRKSGHGAKKQPQRDACRK